MDVGDPSNMERLFHLYSDREALLAVACSLSVDDETIRREIAAGPKRWDRVWCPHTATAVRAWEELPAARRDGPWVLVATAHPAKFETVVEPLIGDTVPVPPALAALLDLPARAEPLAPEPEALRAALLG